MEALKLPTLERERLKVHTFGCQTPVIIECNVIKVVLENICNSKLITEINAVQTPQIRTAVIKVPGENIQQQMEMKGLPLTDVSAGNGESPELSVLTGVDYDWKIVTCKTDFQNC